MSNIGINGASALALVVALAAVGLALWRSRRQPIYLSREQTLEKRVAELENTVATLQRLLYEKENQNGKLLEQVTTLTSRVLELERLVPPAPSVSPFAGASLPPVLACVGDGGMFEHDLAALRSVRTKTGLRFSRLYPVTMARLESKLNRDRLNGTPVRHIHFAVHSGPEGLVFADGVATGLWLSQRLVSAEIVVIAGCESDIVGDLLGVAGAVVTMREAVKNTDAALFTEVFWTGIGEGLPVTKAFDRALERCPPEVAEFVELH